MNSHDIQKTTKSTRKFDENAANSFSQPIYNNNNWNDFANNVKTSGKYYAYTPENGARNANITNLDGCYLNSKNKNEITNIKSIYLNKPSKKTTHIKYKAAPLIPTEPGISLLTPKESLCKDFHICAPTNTHSEYWSSKFLFSLGSRPEAMDSQNVSVIDGKLVQPAHEGWGWIGIKNGYKSGLPLETTNWRMPEGISTKGSYIKIDFVKEGKNVTKLSYVTMTNSRGGYERQTYLHPTEIAVFATNDAVNWTSIHTFSDISYGGDYSEPTILDFPVDSIESYKHWIFIFTKLELNVDGYFRTVALADFSLYGK